MARVPPTSLAYDGELASSILLDDGDGLPSETVAAMPHRTLFGGLGDGPATLPLGIERGAEGSSRGGRHGNASGSTRHSTRGLAPHQRADGEAPDRTPTRTPSPVYQWGHKQVGFGSEEAEGGSGYPAERLERLEREPRGGGKSSSSSSAAHAAARGGGGGGGAGAGGAGVGGGCNDEEVALSQATDLLHMPFSPYLPQYWGGGAMNPQAYYGMMMNNPLLGQGHGKNAASVMDPQVLQMMMAMQAGAMMGQSAQSSGSSAQPVGGSGGPAASAVPGKDSQFGDAEAALQGMGRAGGPGLGADGKRKKSRNKDREMTGGRPVAPEMLAPMSAPAAPAPRERGGGGKGDRRRRGGDAAGEDVGGQQPSGGGGGGGGRGGGKSRSSEIRQGSSNPLIEQLRQKDRNVELSDLAPHIADIAQDQYGSRLIQQKLEVASEEEKSIAFKSVLQKMPLLTTDVFGNYVIQKFFEYGSAEQRRILAEQLVGQVLELSLHMYGCRVVQKALDSVPIEQQVLLIGELKGMVLKCIEDQHGNHVIQKCIERLPTDRIGFIVESFLNQTNRMAKHCYGCRVIQRLIEYCASAQISPLLDETLRYCMELATDQYGNYVVQHVMEHSSRPGDRQMLMQIVRKNILSLSCHKYASNVIEKALSCGTLEERAMLIQAIVGEPGDQHPPLLTMMRDRFGNYIVQRIIALAQGPQREALLWKLHEHMPSLKKQNTYGKHIISALERAQAVMG
mmetsp:Transcript_90826/g.261712  ORF Transcript_90826/g.261712 Transcript_90826/m.261712 type:complete len:735 (+) Transcript_90826:75-2279(+)